MDLRYNVGPVSPTVLGKLFEDNSGSLTLGRAPYMRTSTKYINVKYHNFCAYVANYAISILPIDSYKQPADILTHPLNEDGFILHR